MSPRWFLSCLDINGMVKWSVRWQDIGDFSIIQRHIILILPWNPINLIDFHFVLVMDFEVSNNSNLSRIIPKIQYSIIELNSERIAVMPCACLLAFLALEVDYSSICESLAFVIKDPPIWEHLITGIIHRTYLKDVFGIVVSMLTANWEGVTWSTIL